MDALNCTDQHLRALRKLPDSKQMCLQYWQGIRICRSMQHVPASVSTGGRRQEAAYVTEHPELGQGPAAKMCYCQGGLALPASGLLRETQI